MKQITITLLFSMPFVLQAQQLYVEILSGLNRTAYETDFYPDPQTYIPLGVRIAGGAEHIQLGAELHTNLSNPSFVMANRTEEHFETYYGAFIRGKLAKYPAMGFGLVLRAGAGFHSFETKYQNFVIDKLKYDPVLGFNGGVGVSIPFFKAILFELGYTYHYAERQEMDDVPGIIQLAYNSSYHAFQAGLSLNLVFGKRARDYRHLRENWKWRNGWRG